jgi:hypothetical protein
MLLSFPFSVFPRITVLAEEFPDWLCGITKIEPANVKAAIAKGTHGFKLSGKFGNWLVKYPTNMVINVETRYRKN